MGRALGLLVPEIVLVDLGSRPGSLRARSGDPAEGMASAGLKLALDYLPGALCLDPVVPPRPVGALASAIVWFDSYVTNLDRTPRNTNILVWHQSL